MNAHSMPCLLRASSRPVLGVVMKMSTGEAKLPRTTWSICPPPHQQVVPLGPPRLSLWSSPSESLRLRHGHLAFAETGCVHSLANLPAAG
mmetsp:Transcript_29723/g.79871  ORF Transcript_29723/g.79871 Transcript_29723/m.79871 type:complete len:90 (+) Transcript_29723:1240-1509(+)